MVSTGDVGGVEGRLQLVFCCSYREESRALGLGDQGEGKGSANFQCFYLNFSFFFYAFDSHVSFWSQVLESYVDEFLIIILIVIFYMNLSVLYLLSSPLYFSL